MVKTKKSPAKKYNIAVIGGDGTGPEVVAEGLKVLKAVAQKHNIDYSLKEFDFTGKRYLKTGKLVGDKDVEELKTFDSIYLGAVGDPEVKPGIIEHGVLLKLRFALDQYINLRPVILYPNVWTPVRDKGPEQIDFVVVRENTEGLYVGTGGYLKKGSQDEVATQVSVNTRKGVERCLRYAFEYTKKRNKRKQLTLVGKTNVLTYAWDLWERAFHEIGQKDYPGIKREYSHVDATCMWFVKNPEWFDVIVTDNMFGDIITDLGAVIQGGMGIAAGGNLNPEGVSMYEPIGGSAPKYTGTGKINPMASIMSVQMMLDQMGETTAADILERACVEVITKKMKSMAAGRMGMTTTEVGDCVADAILSLPA
ncbi:MAG: 3-isopropylmalate dehydrogenase [Candidatus Saganbacteria bacterium]|nr:3-isopropylmalate dehydrogenase [Candidatus Saganbacteria bacterium]